MSKPLRLSQLFARNNVQMAIYYSRTLKKLLDAWPGKKYFGVYRFLPGFFIFGGLLEFSMINWRVGETNFCKYIGALQAIGSYEKHLFQITHIKSDKRTKLQ